MSLDTKNNDAGKLVKLMNCPLKTGILFLMVNTEREVYLNL